MTDQSPPIPKRSSTYIHEKSGKYDPKDYDGSKGDEEE